MSDRTIAIVGGILAGALVLTICHFFDTVVVTPVDATLEIAE